MLRRLLQILDSTPTRPKQKFRGQSLVEIAVTTPILFLLIAGAAEVGYLGSNYIVVTDALRTATRYGVNQDITLWTQHEEYARSVYRTACYGQPDKFDYLPLKGLGVIHAPPGLGYLTGAPDISGYIAGAGDDSPANAANWSLFDGVACHVIDSMQPLTFDPSEDDIAVSVLSYTGGDPSLIDANDKTTNRLPSPFIRYPYSNSYCASSGDDPTDYLDNSTHIKDPPWYKFSPFTTIGAFKNTINQPAGGLPDGKVRGFILTGKMGIPPDVTGGGCVGSYFYVGAATINDPYNLIYVLRHSADSLDPGVITAVKASSTNGALIITEMQYYHHVLLGFPPFNLIGGIKLHLWSIFPQFSAVPPPDSHGTPS